MSANLPVIADLRKAVIPYELGTKISRPGIYSGVPMETYHGDLCVGPSVSHSTLWKFDTKSPRHAFRRYYLNPNRPEDEEKDHLALGRAIHHLAGGEGQFREHFAIRPVEFKDWRTKDAKAWRARQRIENPRKGILTPSDVETIVGVAESMNEHPTIQAGILKGLVEMTVVYQDAATGLWVKTRPDVIPVSSGMIADLKTIAEATRRMCERAIGEWGYHGQLAMIDEALWQTVGFQASEHVLVFVEKADPWCVNIKPLEGAAIEWGRLYQRRALDGFARCLEAWMGGEHPSRAWPGYDDDEKSISIPSWLAERYAYERDHGLLPKDPKFVQRQPRVLPKADVATRFLPPPSEDEVVV